MIIVRVPFRLPLGGGGTDLPNYYSQFGGELITSTINKYMFVSINKSATSELYKIYHAETERVIDSSQIKHNIFREALKFKAINYPVEVGSMADIEAGSGMGSSSCFTVGLLAGINTMERKFISAQELAEEAYQVENISKHIGKQDQYAVSFGGVNHLVIDKSGEVTVNPVYLDRDIVRELEDRLLIFYTGQLRESKDILSEQSNKVLDDNEVIEAMHKIKEIGRDIRYALVNGNIDSFGKLLHQHWMVKRSISDKMSNTQIDEWYNLALINGAYGGKLMGAGGGGFLLFCARKEYRNELKVAMLNRGLKYMDFRFEFEGAKVITNI